MACFFVAAAGEGDGVESSEERTEEETIMDPSCMYSAAAVTARWTGSRRLVKEGEVSTIAVDVCILACMMCCVADVLCAIAQEPC
jgi:hypothetical protein